MFRAARSNAIPGVDVRDSPLRLQTLVRLRWVAVGGQTVTILAVHYGLDFPLPLATCLSVVGLSAALNILLQLAFPASQR
jgi:two-component system sensor histidine kinase RegB